MFCSLLPAERCSHVNTICRRITIILVRCKNVHRTRTGLFIVVTASMLIYVVVACAHHSRVHSRTYLFWFWYCSQYFIEKCIDNVWHTMECHHLKCTSPALASLNKLLCQLFGHSNSFESIRQIGSNKATMKTPPSLDSCQKPNEIIRFKLCRRRVASI